MIRNLKITKKGLASLWLPITLIVLYLITAYLFKDILPSGGDVSENFAKFFARFGYEIVFIGAFLEAALIIDIFVPGTSIVLIGAYFASIGVISYPIFLIVSAAGFFLGYLMDYLIGFLGFSDILRRFGMGRQLDKVHAKLEKVGGKAFFLGYIHPDSASVFAVAAGVIKMDLKEFVIYNLIAGSFWLTFWTMLIYLFGERVSEYFDNQLLWLIFLVPVVFIVINMIKDRREK